MINDIISVLLDVNGSYVIGKLRTMPDKFITLKDPVQLVCNGPGDYTMSKFAVIEKELAIPTQNALAFGTLPDDIKVKYVSFIKGVTDED